MKIIFTLMIGFGFYGQTLSQEIPKEYLGNYKGELKIYNPNLVNQVDMELEITETDTIGQYNYILKYHSKPTSDIRKYKLIASDSVKSQFILDENNGIKIPTFFVLNSLQSFFSVQSSLLTTKVSFNKDTAVFEISMASTKIADTTATYDNQYEVLSYPIGIYQKAILLKE